MEEEAEDEGEDGTDGYQETEVLEEDVQGEPGAYSFAPESRPSDT